MGKKSKIKETFTVEAAATHPATIAWENLGSVRNPISAVQELKPPPEMANVFQFARRRTGRSQCLREAILDRETGA